MTNCFSRPSARACGYRRNRRHCRPPLPILPRRRRSSARAAAAPTHNLDQGRISFTGQKNCSHDIRRPVVCAMASTSSVELMVGRIARVAIWATMLYFSSNGSNTASIARSESAHVSSSSPCGPARATQVRPLRTGPSRVERSRAMGHRQRSSGSRYDHYLLISPSIRIEFEGLRN